jgi:hypothetical protein
MQVERSGKGPNYFRKTRNENYPPSIVATLDQEPDPPYPQPDRGYLGAPLGPARGSFFRGYGRPQTFQDFAETWSRLSPRKAKPHGHLLWPLRGNGQPADDPRRTSESATAWVVRVGLRDIPSGERCAELPQLTLHT